MERFIGILIEHYAGAMPLWLAPVQAVVLNISEHQRAYAENVCETLLNAGLRAEADLRNEKITYKIREHSLQKLPYQLIVGDKEVAASKVAVRTRKGEDLGQMAVADFIARLAAEIAARSAAAGV
jgi:threonyl-tRNA synthetase